MRKALTAIVLAAGMLLGCSVQPEMEKKCREDCPTYGAVYVRVSTTQPGSESAEAYECWCRRGAESGGGSEPLRIW